MNFIQLLVVFSTLAHISLAALDFGVCSIGIPKTGVIEDLVDDTSNYNEGISLTGTVSLKLTDDNPDENGRNYIDIEILDSDKNTLIIKTNKNFGSIEDQIEIHSNPFVLQRTFDLICDDDDDNSATVTVQLTVIDSNNHDPEFLLPSYTYNLPRILEPSYDLTSEDLSKPILVKDMDLTNMEFTFKIAGTEAAKFSASSVAQGGEGSSTHRVILKVTEELNIKDPITLSITAFDEDRKSSQPTEVVLSSPNEFGTCAINDGGRLEFGYIQETIKDVDTLDFSFSYTGDIKVSYPNDTDSGKPYIKVTADGEKLSFTTTSDFEKFDHDHKALPIQPAITVFRTVTLDCGEVSQSFTFGLVVEDTNNNPPMFKNDNITYNLPGTLMPKVDLTTVGEAIIVYDDDFSNSGITFTVEKPFYMETVLEESEDNQRQYRGILRVSSYIELDNEGKTITVTATDSGDEPKSTSATITFEKSST